MDVWPFLQQKLSDHIPAMLLLVLESEGSSPGRQGFKMAVAADGDIVGTIGGGIMEYKLVEKARALLEQNSSSVSTMRQYHDKQHSADQSGMICSGSQLICFIALQNEDLELIGQIAAQPAGQYLYVDAAGLKLDTNAAGKSTGYRTARETWYYLELLHHQPVVHIFGSGHVGLALSEMLRFLGFYIKIYDDREGLNTLEQNHFAHEKHIISYDQAAEMVQSEPSDYAVIMTIGYRQDKLIFRQLLDREWFYLGMLGSDHKLKTLREELAAEGLDPVRWDKVFAPIGIPVFSKTAREIAVSIAAEMIREKNRHLPTGRRGI